jgi:hypothetical protein
MADSFARINGGMIQSGQFNGQLVSLVGKLTSHDKIQTADGTIVTLLTDQMNEQPIVNPDMVVEVMGQPFDETTFTVCNTVSAGMCVPRGCLDLPSILVCLLA